MTPRAVDWNAGRPVLRWCGCHHVPGQGQHQVELPKHILREVALGYARQLASRRALARA